MARATEPANEMAYTLGELAEHINAELHGNADCLIERVATLANAGQGDISFLANSNYRKYLKKTSASAVIISKSDLKNCPVHALVLENPYLGYARVARLLYPGETEDKGVAESAVIHETAKIDSSACIKNHVVIGSNSTIGKYTVVEAGVVIGKNVQLGSDCHIFANVVLCDSVVIGDHVIVHPGAVIGSDGFGIANDRGTWVKIPQVGRVIIGNHVEIGANTTIDRGAIEDTVIENGVKLDNQVQVGHNVHIGENTAIAGCVGIAGSTHIGKRCMVGGAVGISGHITICDDVIITGMSTVAQSVTTPGLHSSGIPLSENLKWRKNVVRFQHLDELYKRVVDLEKKTQGS